MIGTNRARSERHNIAVECCVEVIAVREKVCALIRLPELVCVLSGIAPSTGLRVENGDLHPSRSNAQNVDGPADGRATSPSSISSLEKHASNASFAHQVSHFTLPRKCIMHFAESVRRRPQIAYLEGADIEDITAMELTELGGVIQVSVRAGNQRAPC